MRLAGPRFALAAAVAGGLLCLTPAAQAADSGLRFHAGPVVGDLACPIPPQAPLPQARPVDEPQMPPPEMLGPLARPVIREQPVIGPTTLPVQAFGLGRPFRIAVWGDSHVAAGAFMPTVVERLRDRGFTVGTRFLPPSMGRANVRLRGLRAYCIGTGWSTELAYSSPGRLQVGPALMNRVVDAGPDSYLWLDLRGADLQPTVRQLRIVLRAPDGAALNVSVDDGPEQQAVLDRGSGSQTLAIATDGRIATLKLRVSRGRVVLHGFILDEADPPGITFDVFGTPSSTMRGWETLDPAYLAQSLHGEDYDAVVLQYGTNEGSDPRFERDRYAGDLRAALETLRQVFPHASCVLVGPPDRGVLIRHDEQPDLLRYSRTMQDIEAIQAEVGARFGCAHWDWQALMGGAGGSYGWALSGPPLMGRDLTHLTAAGYRLTGEALARSLGF